MPFDAKDLLPVLELGQELRLVLHVDRLHPTAIRPRFIRSMSQHRSFWTALLQTISVQRLSQNMAKDRRVVQILRTSACGEKGRDTAQRH